jgi:hypothetical protein
LDLENIMEKHRIDAATTLVIKHGSTKWLNNETSTTIKELVPDASQFFLSYSTTATTTS